MPMRPVPMMPTFWRAAQNRATPARKNYRCEPGYKPGEDAGLAPASGVQCAPPRNEASRQEHVPREAQAARRLDIDVIKPRAAQCDQARAVSRQRFQHRSIQRVVYKHAHRWKTRDHLPRLLTQVRIEKDQLMPDI